MQATPQEIDALFDVQQIDLEIARLKRELENLPQRQTILDARNKRDTVKAKRAQIELLKKDTTKKLTRINDEDMSLKKKESGVQAAIEAAGNDFRNAEVRTKELNGIFRRREELKEGRDKEEAQLAKIKELEEQVERALAEIEETEQQATKSFKSQGGSLKRAITKSQKARNAVMADVSPEVSDFYSKVASRFDTVAIARLEGSTCSVCRTKIEQGHVLDLRNQAPLAICPSCRRVLVITE